MTLPDTNRVTATARPDGVDLHVDGYTRTTLKDLIGLLAENDDLRERFFDLFEPAPAADPHSSTVVDRDDAFLDRLMPELPTTIRLHREPARLLGRALRRIARRQNRRPLAVVPQPRDWRRSA